LETLPFISLIITLVEVAIRKPIKANAILFIICIAAFVNLAVGPSVLSYSLRFTPDPAAIIFPPVRPSVDALPVLQAILIISLVDIPIYKC
jgi:hypothetical protein